MLRRSEVRRSTRLFIVAVAMVSWSLTILLPAHAGHERPVVGTALYSDGTTQKSGPSGSTITVNATGAKANTPYTLRAAFRADGVTGLVLCSVHGAIFDQSVGTVWSNGSGAIPNTTATVSWNLGARPICFWEEAPGGSVTSSVVFDVVP